MKIHCLIILFLGKVIQFFFFQRSVDTLPGTSCPPLSAAPLFYSQWASLPSLLGGSPPPQMPCLMLFQMSEKKTKVTVNVQILSTPLINPLTILKVRLCWVMSDEWMKPRFGPSLCLSCNSTIVCTFETEVTIKLHPRGYRCSESQMWRQWQHEGHKQQLGIVDSSHAHLPSFNHKSIGLSLHRCCSSIYTRQH